MPTSSFDNLLQQLTALPTLPGVYRFFAKDDQLLYVGKALNLKRRVSSYFQKDHQGTRIGLMVSRIARLEITVVRTEAEALLLENNLIKTLNPKFNILFRDDKSYPYLKISNHPYPRISYYRGKVDKQQHYFGPYPNSQAVKDTIALLQKVFLLRSCENTVFANRSRPCLLYQIKRCSAPCMLAALQQKDVALELPDYWQKYAQQLDYAQDVNYAIDFLRGNTDHLLQQLQQRMQQHSQRLEFEQAALLRNQIAALSSVLQNQTMELSSANANQADVDVVAVCVQGGRACVNLAMIRGGRHLGDRAFFPSQVEDALAMEQIQLQEQSDAVPADWVAQQVLQAFLLQHYADKFIPKVIVLSTKLDPQVAQLLSRQAQYQVQLIYQPQGQRKLWLTMVTKNANMQLQRLLAQEGSQRNRTLALVTALGWNADVNSKELADFRVECFDISHTSGEATQASCVVYQQHALQPSQYRRYNISEITGGDDYAAMRQVLTRRYTKLAQQLQLQQQQPLLDDGADAVGVQMPNLVLIDGGKGQVAVAREVFADLGLDISLLVGVEKGDKRKVGLEELVFADGRKKAYLGKDSAALMLIAQIRDEAHRFAITGMRAKRASVRTGGSQLEDIAGIGAKRRAELLKRFGGVRGVSGASVEELTSVNGISKTLAEHIYAALH